MLTPTRKLVYLLWSVIAALLLGFIFGGFLLLRHANNIDQANTQLNGDNASLRRQIQEVKAASTPTPTSTPAPASVATPSPIPASKPAVVPTVSPKATPAQ